MKDIVTAVLEHAERAPGEVCVELVSSRKAGAARTFAEVVRGAERAAAAYVDRGLARGDVVVLVGTHHIDFYASWLGAVFIGAIPTVIAEPSVRIDRSVYTDRLEALLQRIDGKLLALDPAITLDARGLETSTYEALALFDGRAPPRAQHDAKDLLLLQHSSGTTGLHKGVMLSHGAIDAHARSYARAIEATHRDVVATWLPLYHDMGLIACFVLPLMIGMKVVWLSPFEWVANPSALLEAISRHRATLAWLPNFAFQFLAQRTRSQPGTYDLSSLRAVINCSEPVTDEAMSLFAERFAGDGFNREALHACYALAENVFAVSTSSVKVPSRRVRSADRPITLVSNGPCIEGCDVRILDGEGRQLEIGKPGRIAIRSAFLFDGYFRRDDLNAALFDADGYFDTGDVGFVDEEGHLFVTGRLKDLVIVGGRNLYPQDVEQIAGETLGVHPGRAVAFGVLHPKLGTEALVVLAESDDPEPDWPNVARRIKHEVSAQLDVDLLDARIVPRMSLRKSTSGKLARGGNREWYLEGRFGPLPPSLESSKETP